MGRKAKWPPVPRRHASGQARVCWKGAEWYLGEYGTPEAEAAYRALLKVLAAKKDAPPRPHIGALTVDGAIAFWVAEVLPTHDPRTQDRYRRALTVLSRVCGTEPAAAFGCGSLDRVRASMRSGSWLLPGEAGRHGLGNAPSSKGRGKWSPATANRMTGRIKTVWRFLELRGHVPAGSWGNLRTLRALPVPSAPRREWTTADVLAVAGAIRRGHCGRMLAVQLWSGARSGEVRGMLWDEVDTSGEVWLWRPARHKNAWRGHGRTIALGPQAQAVLVAQREREPRSALVFPCRGGEYSASAYAYTVRRAAQRCGLAGLTPYAARHTAKDRVARLGGIDGARAVLGHTSSDMTSRYGASVDTTLAAEMARKAG